MGRLPLYPPSRDRGYGRFAAGFHYRLLSSEGDELGEFNTIVPNWSVGDTFTTADGRKFRIWKIVPIEDVDSAVFNGLWMVELVKA